MTAGSTARGRSAVLNAKRGASNVVLLTLLGGGAFGNEEEWILSALRRGLELVAQLDIDVRIVSYGAPSPAVLGVAKDFEWGPPRPSDFGSGTLKTTIP